MPPTTDLSHDGAATASGPARGHPVPDVHPARIALLGNPNTGKTTLFNRLTGLRHKTSNFPGTTLEARVGAMRLPDSPASAVAPERPATPPAEPARAAGAEVIDLPGVYSLELAQAEAEVCREVLAGEAAPRGEPLAAPDAVCVVADAANLLRNLALVGEVLRRRLPTVVVVNMIDVARRRGLHIDADRLGAALGCEAVLCCARSGDGLDRVRAALARARVSSRTPPGDEPGLRAWAEAAFESATTLARAPGAAATGGEQPAPLPHEAMDRATDAIDRVVTHPLAGVLIFVCVMGALFWSIFSLAAYPMEWIESVFGVAGDAVRSALPEGVIRDLLADGVVGGVGATVIFLPQICLLFFLISLLEDTGYLARAALLMDRVLRPFGLPGHAFVPLLSSHACALPGIMACRAIPDRRERLAAILVAPFMTCSARLPVYVLVTGLLFPHDPRLAALAFIACYALGIGAGVFSALVARRTILRGPARAMAIELPPYRPPSLRNAARTTFDRGLVFLRNAGTNILMICVVLWWLSSFPRVEPPPEAVALHQKVVDRVHSWTTSDPTTPEQLDEQVRAWQAEAQRLESRHAIERSYAGRIGRAVQPVFAPLGYDWQLSIGVVMSFAAREVFASTMAVIVTGSDDTEDASVREAIGAARRDDATPVFTRATCWSLLVYYVLAMQCLPTLAVTAREAGGKRWALLQLAWMSIVAYAAAALVFALAS